MIGGALQGQTVIVAGGGRGIGRACARHLASEGARVLVADPGVSADGTSVDELGVAEEVARAIVAGGGVAVGVADAVGPRVADGERIVGRCLEEFGALDAVLTPAAILRDRMIFNMTEEEWNSVISVDLSGTFSLVRAACVVMRGQRRGRIVTFSSAGGMEGLPGTSNYAAAKMGVVGLTKSVAREMSRYGVAVNCIAPRAVTRLTEVVASSRRDADLGADLGDPEDVAPLASYLASEACAVTGTVTFCGGHTLAAYPEFVPVKKHTSAERLDVATLAAVMEQSLYPRSSALDAHLHPLDPADIAPRDRGAPGGGE